MLWKVEEPGAIARARVLQLFWLFHPIAVNLNEPRLLGDFKNINCGLKARSRKQNQPVIFGNELTIFCLLPESAAIVD